MKGECRLEGQCSGRGGRSQDKEGLVNHLKDFAPCPTENEKPLKGFEQSSDIIIFLKGSLRLLWERTTGVGKDTGSSEEVKAAR